MHFGIQKGDKETLCCCSVGSFEFNIAGGMVSFEFMPVLKEVTRYTNQFVNELIPNQSPGALFGD